MYVGDGGWVVRICCFRIRRLLALKQLQDVSRWAQDVANMVHDGSRWAEDGSKMALRCSRMVQPFVLAARTSYVHISVLRSQATLTVSFLAGFRPPLLSGFVCWTSCQESVLELQRSFSSSRTDAETETETRS